MFTAFANLGAFVACEIPPAAFYAYAKVADGWDEVSAFALAAVFFMFFVVFFVFFCCCWRHSPGELFGMFRIYFICCRYEHNFGSNYILRL